MAAKPRFVGKPLPHDSARLHVSGTAAYTDLHCSLRIEDSVYHGVPERACIVDAQHVRISRYDGTTSVGMRIDMQHAERFILPEGLHDRIGHRMFAAD